MLSLRLLKVSGVLLPERLANSNSNNASSSSEVGFKEMMPVSSWTVQLRHGSQQHRTQFAAVDSGNQALPPNQSRRTDLMAAVGSPGQEEVEFEDRGGEEKVEIALFFDAAPEVELWLPLQPANHNDSDTRDYGAIQVSVMYTDDYVAQGYMFGLFCGLTPLRMDHLPWSGRTS